MSMTKKDFIALADAIKQDRPAFSIDAGETMKLYSYNQLRSLFGDDDKQVILIRKHLELVGMVPSNMDLEAFKRID